MESSKRLFGKTSKGEEVYAYTITNGKIGAEILDFGATLRSIFVPDKNGKVEDVTIGYEDFAPYETSGGYEGKTVGRYANRICGGKFEINGTEYNVEKNENNTTCLHGGGEFSFNFWKVENFSDSSITLSFESADGSFGFPGKMEAKVTFTVTDRNGVEIRYNAVADKDTIINFTNHSYFNLAGKGDVLGHLLKINANAFTPTDEINIPTGEIKSVAGTPMDFREFKEIGKDIKADYEQIVKARGYDHNFCLIGEKGTLRAIAEAYEPESGRRMTAYTDLPGVQLYTGNFLERCSGKGGRENYQHCGFCLETQYYADTPNHKNFPQCTFKAGEEYNSVTVFEFSAD